MKLKVLGCSGGIGQQGRTTALLFDHTILIDAGSGVADLPLEQLVKIDHVFLTHAHLDHILGLPLLIDSVINLRATPLAVHAPQRVIDALRQHIFNWTIWPDFSEIPSATQPSLHFYPFEVGDCWQHGAYRLQALPVDHHVPAVAYAMQGPAGTTVFSGDTGPSRPLHAALQALPALQRFIVECAFPDREAKLAARAGHFSPSSLAAFLSDLPCKDILITHLKPGQANPTMAEVAKQLSDRTVTRLQDGDELEV